MYRTTVTIWTSYDPADIDLTDLAWEATSGDSLATDWHIDIVPDEQLPEGVASFFNLLEEDEDAEETN